MGLLGSSNDININIIVSVSRLDLNSSLNIQMMLESSILKYFLFAGITLCFGGGVLLATVLLHMLKEVREVLEQAAGKGALPESLEEYPFAELMVGAGKLPPTVNFLLKSLPLLG